MAATQSPVRVSGKVAADEIAAAEGKSLEELTAEAVQHAERGMPLNLNGGPASRPEDVGLSLTPAFSRMRTDWQGPDREIVDQVRKGVDLMIENLFADVFTIQYRIQQVVRVPQVNHTTGEVFTDAHGLPVYVLDPDTREPVEDWSLMRAVERERFIYQLTTGLFRWEQRAADLWGEAMLARATFEEAFSHGFEEIKGDRATIDDRTARARIRAADRRYFAVYTSYLSRRAEAVVRTADRLCLRLSQIDR